MIGKRFRKGVDLSGGEWQKIAIARAYMRGAAALQADLDAWMRSYNEERPHQGRWCFGKTPMQTFMDTKPLAREKMIRAA